MGYNNRIKNNQISRHIGYDNRIKNNQISRHMGYNNRIKNNQISRHIHSRKSGLSILRLNIRSLNANNTEFRLFIERINIHNPISVICLNECWLENTHNMSNFYLPNCTFYHTTKNVMDTEG